MLGGTSQYGLKTRYFIWRAKIGVWVPVYSLPTTTFIRSAEATVSPSRSKALSWKAGMLTTIGGSPNSWAIQRQRSSVSSIWRSRAAIGVFNSRNVPFPATPSGASPCRSWNRLIAATIGAPQVACAAAACSPAGRSPVRTSSSASRGMAS